MFIATGACRFGHFQIPEIPRFFAGTL